MSKLILKSFRCLVDTNEIGSESPYFLTYVGQLGALASNQDRGKLRLTRQGNWHNEVDPGDGTWAVNEEVFSGILDKTKTLVMSILVEEDEGRDFSEAERVNIENVLNARMTLRSSSVVHVDGVASEMRSLFKSRVLVALTSTQGAQDDYMGVRRVSLTGAPGNLSPTLFSNDGGTYQVNYRQA